MLEDPLREQPDHRVFIYMNLVHENSLLLAKMVVKAFFNSSESRIASWSSARPKSDSG